MKHICVPNLALPVENCGLAPLLAQHASRCSVEVSTALDSLPATVNCCLGAHKTCPRFFAPPYPHSMVTARWSDRVDEPLHQQAGCNLHPGCLDTPISIMLFPPRRGVPQKHALVACAQWFGCLRLMVLLLAASCGACCSPF